MKRIIFVVAIMLSVAALGAAPAQSQVGNAPWCAVMSMDVGAVYWDCQYYRFEDCVPNVLAGNRGFCNPNPRWEPKADVPKTRPKRR